MRRPATRAVLLVEDNPADIYLIQKAVEECGPDIHLSIVPNGRDALAFLRHEGAYALQPSPTLILLDLNLPKLHGHQVLAELRHLPAYQATPVVIFSAARKEMEEQRCLHLGANAYVQKPSDFDTFCAAIHAIVGQWLPQGGSH
jgi:CheY-like chemotaxis protein